MREGRQTVTAFGVLADVGTGYPMLLTEMTILTALRTAATSAIAAKYLAPKGSRTMAIIGNGAQSRIPGAGLQGAARHRTSCGSTTSTRRLRKNARKSRRHGFDIIICATSEDAVEGADIITTVHRRQAVRHDPDRQHGRLRRPHQRGRRRLPRQDRTASRHPAALRHIRRIIRRRRASRVEIQQLDADHPVTELWQVIAGKAVATGATPGNHPVRQCRLRDRGFFSAALCA